MPEALPDMVPKVEGDAKEPEGFESCAVNVVAAVKIAAGE